VALLTGWAKRIKITVDSGDIDSALSNFPTLVYLSTSSGYNNVDVSCIFDELESNDNRKKIAITISDGVTQCYVEIAKWDHANEKAWLWVKVPNVASGADTELWIYYDKTHADNDTYVGDPSDAVVHNVWDINHKLVTHMRDDPDNEHIRDSTQYANDGTKKGAGEPVLTADGKIGDAQDFDGLDDYVNLGNDDSLDITSAITVETWFKMETWESLNSIVGKWDAKGSKRCFWLALYLDDSIYFFISWDGVSNVNAIFSGATTGVWYHVVGTYDGVNIKIYVNGDFVHAYERSGTIYSDPTQNVYIGSEKGRRYFDGIIDETHISNIARKDSWIKASYESWRDHLLDFGSEEDLALGQPAHLRRRGRMISLGGVR